MKRALITGISGFVGPYLAAELFNGGIEVYGIDRTGKTISCVKKSFKADVTDGHMIDNIISDILPDVVFHLAAQSSVSKSWAQPELTRNIIVRGTDNVLLAVAKHNPKAKVIVVSSAEVYGTQGDKPLREDAPLRPLNPYGKARVEQEDLCAKYVKNGLNVIVLRSFPHTGPGQLPNFVCSSFAKQIAEAELDSTRKIIVGNLKIRRDISDVRDIVKAYVIAAQKCEYGGIYNVCSGRCYSLGEILDILLSFSVSKPEVVSDPGLTRSNDILVLWGDGTKFRKATDWKPVWDVRQTLKEMLEYWRKELTE
jgi:GDP-4-dehydro-6-deoxy-D-mannose reductase